MVWRILLVVLLAIQPLTAWAQVAERRVALIIANGDYSHAGRLSNPTNDARIVAQSARSAGFATVTLSQNLTLTDFQRALRDFRAQAQGAKVAMVYYAGHGIEGGGKNWLIPVDAALSSDLDLPYEAIDLDRVMESISGAQVRMVVLDACRNNPFGRSWRSGSRAVNRGLGQVDVDDVLVIYAAAPGQTASDGTGGNSPFATSLARRLTQPDLPIQLLGGAVRDDVLQSTGGEQRPFVSASITGTPVYLVRGAPPAQQVQQSAAAPASAVSVNGDALDALTWQGAVGANTVEAFNEYKRQFPNGRFKVLAEQNIARLSRPAATRSEGTQLAVNTVTQTTPNRPQQASSPRVFFADSSTRAVSRSQLTALTAAELRIARNEIYARHGYRFASPEMQSHFERFPWYRESGAALQLNDMEKANARLMKEVERTGR